MVTGQSLIDFELLELLGLQELVQPWLLLHNPLHKSVHCQQVSHHRIGEPYPRRYLLANQPFDKHHQS